MITKTNLLNKINALENISPAVTEVLRTSLNPFSEELSESDLRVFDATLRSLQRMYEHTAKGYSNRIQQIREDEKKLIENEEKILDESLEKMNQLKLRLENEE